MSDEVDSLVKKIAEHSGLSEDEIRKRMAEKVKAFAGLLTELGAAYAVAKELGVDVSVESEIHRKTPIGQLKPGMERVTVVGRVMRVFPPATYEKNGKKGKYCRIILADNTGEISLTLWNRDVRYVEEGTIRVGDVVEVINARVTEYQNSPRLSLAFDSRIIVNPEEENNVPEAPPIKKIAEIKDGDNAVNTVVQVIRIFEPRKVQKSDGESEMVALLAGDETGTARIVIWDANKLPDIKEGDTIRITAGYARQEERGLSIHVGKLGIIQKTDESVTARAGKNAVSQDITRKRIDQLQEGDRFVAVRGTVARVFAVREILVCKTCGRRVREENGRYICENCGETEAIPRKILSMELDDGYGRIRAVFFGDLAERILNDVGGEDQLTGEEIVATGYVRKSNVSDRLELFVKDAARPDYDGEIRVLLEQAKIRLEE